MTLAFAALAADLGISRVPAADAERKSRIYFIGDLFNQLNRVRGNRLLALAFAGNAYFIFIVGIFLASGAYDVLAADQPRRSGALLISNHVSFVDRLLFMVAADRPVHFFIGRQYYNRPWVHPLAQVPRVVPIPPEIRPHEAIEALSDCGRANFNRSGTGVEHLVKNIARGGNTGAPPVIPIALMGVCGSVFRFFRRKISLKKPGRVPRVMTVRFGKAFPSTITEDEVRAAVAELMK
jgi:acyl-[acyl-carrier-protein]-phospholipid O-acyltransferase/long-chain-fatty-acid--[acyl-carrier-protein] ligase